MLPGVVGRVLNMDFEVSWGVFGLSVRVQGGCLCLLYLFLFFCVGLFFWLVGLVILYWVGFGEWMQFFPGLFSKGTTGIMKKIPWGIKLDASLWYSWKVSPQDSTRIYIVWGGNIMTRWTNNWKTAYQWREQSQPGILFAETVWRRVTNFLKSPAAVVKNWGLQIVSLFQGNLLLELELIISREYIEYPLISKNGAWIFPFLWLFQLSCVKFAQVVSWSICCSQSGPPKMLVLVEQESWKYFLIGGRMQTPHLEGVAIILNDPYRTDRSWIVS